jgi:hypothetical protein
MEADETRGQKIGPWLGIPRGVGVNPTREPLLPPKARWA